MTKDQIIKFLLEDILGASTDNELFLIKEDINSVDDPEYKRMVNYYTRYAAPKSRFEILSDLEKIFVINYVDKVVNGSSKQMKHPTEGFPNKTQDAITTILATEYVKQDEIVDDWKPDTVNQQKIFEFLLSFYNPYGSQGRLSNVGYRAASGVPGIDPLKIDIDLVLDGFTKAIQEQLVNKKYNPNSSPFDYSFVKIAWPQDIMDIFSKKQRRKDINIDPIVKSSTVSGDEDEELDVASTYGASDVEYSLKKDKDKFQLILDQLNETERKVLQGFFNFIFSETKNEEAAASKLIDAVYDVDGDISEIDVEDISSKGKESMYDYIGKELGIEYSEATESNLKSKVSQLRPKLIALFRDPRFKEIMGIEDWSEKNLDILKGTGTKGREWKKISSKDYEELDKSLKPTSGTAYDEFGKPLPLDDKGKVIRKSKRNLSEVMLENIQDINDNFNFRFNKINNTLDKISKINNYINEGYDVAVKDLDQDIYNYINNTVDGLNKANYMLNELEIVSNDIKFEYPEVSEKLQESIEPLIEELERLIFKVKNIKNSIRPFLSESKKKFNLEEDDLEEERITNPDSKDFVKKRENFIGSHIYGEDLGGLGKMYVAYSYGEQFPAYVWFDDKWYHNTSNYVLDDGTINEPTNQHKKDMRPAQDTHGLSTFALNTMINKFKNKHGLGDNVHTDVEPGEKN